MRSWTACAFSSAALLASSCARANLDLQLADTGRVTSVTVDGKPASGSVTLYVPKPDWKGTVATSDDARVTGRPPGGGDGAELIEGVMPAVGDPLLNYRQETSRGDGQLRLRYSITPTRDLEAGPTVVRLALPLGQFAGRRWALCRTPELRSGTLPKELSQPYAFLHESGFDWFGWECSDEKLLAVVPEWRGFWHMQVQDNRQFKAEGYEVQLYARTPAVLKQGETYSFAFALKLVEARELEAARQEHERRQKELAQSMTSHGPAGFVEVRPNAETVPAFGKFELSVRLQGEFTNPFDPEDVSLDGHFVTPAGKEQVVPGFFHWGYERTNAGGTEKVTPTGEHGWRVRYCPTAEGEYRYRLTLNDGKSEARSEEGTFRATKSQHPGLVRVAKANPLYFEFDNGAPYFAIGENVCWPGGGGTYDYDNYWKKLADNGANYARIWVGPFDCFTLERKKRDASDPAGVGWFDLANSWRMDYVLNEAEKLGIRVMFCIDSFNSLRFSDPYPAWQNCPYNAANGGPCRTPEEFFTNPEALGFFKRRLRYIVARWSHSPAVMSWEFWNEVNIIEKYVSETSVPWHRDMARYLRELDPYDHLITTSWAGHQGDPKVDELPEMDYIQSHQYGARDEAGFMAGICYEKAERFKKPHYFGEFGTGTQAEGTREDTDGIHLHNGLWSGVMSLAAGTGMLWWWDNYVEPLNLYHHFRPVAEFVTGIPFNRTEFRKAQVGDLSYAGTPPPVRLETLTITTDRGSWEPAPFNQPNTFVVHHDGRVEPADRLARVLHGLRNHKDKHNPATFEVDYTNDGKFIVVVTGVSGHGGAKLKVYLDGELKIDKDFADPDGTEKTDTLTQYNGDYAVDMPKGKHTVRVVNDGNDWLYVDYRLPEYRRRTDPGIQVYGLQTDPAKAGGLAAILWVKNERYNWYTHNQGEELRPIPPSRFALSGVPDGAYEVEWWDTYTGASTGRQPATATGGRLTVTLGEFVKDVACKVLKVR
jgi:hypothetical protein